MKLSEILVKTANEIIYSPASKEMARKLPKYFTRNRKMPFEDLMIFMLFHLKCSIPSSLRRYFKAKEETTTRSQQSLSEAREKLTVETFEYLYRKNKETIVEHRTGNWHGYRLYANDGTKIALPDDMKLLEHYGATGRNATSPTVFKRQNPCQHRKSMPISCADKGLFMCKRTNIGIHPSGLYCVTQQINTGKFSKPLKI